MAGLHTHTGTGGVALARPTTSKIYFTIGDAVAKRSQATKPDKHAVIPAG